jgi:hypothetical protein
MGEGGLSASEVGKDIAAEHQHHHQGEEHRHDRIVTIIEASLLAVVALLAAWSGYASSKWSTESRIDLAEASTARTEASRANLQAMELRNLDYSAFNAWFGAWVVDDVEAQEIAVRRFRPDLKLAFDVWIAQDPFTNPDVPAGPTDMPEYVQPQVEEAKHLDARADEKFTEGSEAGETADKYVRATVYLATVLFLVGISGHFRVRVARYGLVGVGVVVLMISVVTLLTLPGLP